MCAFARCVQNGVQQERQLIEITWERSQRQTTIESAGIIYGIIELASRTRKVREIAGCATTDLSGL